MKLKGSDTKAKQSRKTDEDAPKRIIPKDPMKEFRSWFKLAGKAGEHEPDAMALATADESCRPSVRMVLFRDLISEGLCFFTNYDSRKACDLKWNPYGSLLFYWPGIYRQVRIEGKIRKAPAGLSDQYFNSRHIHSRISACISPQSSVIPDRLFLEAMHEAFSNDLGGKAPSRPKNWGGYILVPDRFEFWTGRENRLHDRIQYRKSRSGWIVERLAP